MGLIKIEGKEVSLPDAIIDAGTSAIRAALSVDFPDVENADIQIVSPTRAGAPKAATVVKRGTGKGSAQREVMESLAAAPEYVNPAIAMAIECMAEETRGDQEAIMRVIRSGAMERAVAEGEREGLAVHKSQVACGHAPPIAARKVPIGF